MRLRIAITVLFIFAAFTFAQDNSRFSDEAAVNAARTKKPPPPPPPSGWKNLGKLQGVWYPDVNYTPIIITPTGISVFANTNNDSQGLTDGTWYKKSGTFTKVNGASVQLSPSDIFDQPSTPGDPPAIRTTGVARGTSGKCYAIIHVSTWNQYRFAPAWATADDAACSKWTYQGKLVIDGMTADQLNVLASGANLIVQEDKPAVLDLIHPANNRFVFWEDAYTINAVTKRLVLVMSSTGLPNDWHFYRDGSGTVVDVWPTSLPTTDSAVFPTATRTPYGYHIIAGDQWPVSYHRHVVSCDMVHYSVLETKAATFNGNKGTNLAYELSTGLLHALSTGIHYTRPETAFTCP